MSIFVRLMYLVNFQLPDAKDIVTCSLFGKIHPLHVTFLQKSRLHR